MSGVRTVPLIYCIQATMATILAIGSTPSLAQTEPAETSEASEASTATVVYLPADFARFAPRTALDMVDNIPDFRLTETSDDRGLGNASQNLLINGQRVASKATDAQTTLRQISASAVVRIEVLDGARLGIPGLTGRVANVVVESDSVRGQFRWEAQQRQLVEDQIFTGAISLSGRIGSTEFSLSLDNSNGLRRGGTGPEVVTDATGVIILNRQQTDIFHRDIPTLTGTLRRSFDDGSVLNLNLSAERDLFFTYIDAVATPVGGIASDERFRRNNKEWTLTGGGDYEFDLGSGRLKIIALQSWSHDPSTSTFTVRDRTPGAIAAGSRFINDAREGESVVRAEYGWTARNGSWQIALEGAYNYADTIATLGSLQPDGSYADIPLPGGISFVDEWRAELSLTRGWTLTDHLSVQATLGGEYSRIRQTSAGGLSREFIRPKGALTIAWQAARQLTVNAAIRRQVGQLSFDDFSSAVDVQNNNASVGNVELVPEQSWRFELEGARGLGQIGSITLGAYAEVITDIVDSIPLSATEEGIGNLPHANRYGFTGRGTVQFDTLGWRGARVDFNGEWLISRVRDPLTGDRRRISGDMIRNWSVDFRHDIPGTAIAWGASTGEQVAGPQFRLDQIQVNGLTRPFSSVFVEHKDVLGLTVRLSLRNLLGIQDFINRDVSVNRRDGPIAFRERQLRSIGLIGVLVVSGSF